ncbi:ras association domain-containing protein 5-like, partial [Python bivittatus]|uniref:Ras association domain-containing protein 5-like n=1 Tax=Python bivittatus TaxID=176946 RepID=A0A9F5N1Z3_PYTBI
MAMASPAIGQYPYPLLLDREQQLFLQSLSANERKKILKGSASNDMKQPPPPPPPSCRGRPLGSAVEAERGAAVGQAAEDGAEIPGAPLLPGKEAAMVAHLIPRELPASPGPAAKPFRSGQLHHQRLRLRSGAPRLLPDVRTIFEQPRDPRVREEKGEGHRFEGFALWRGWCDLCGEAVQQRAPRCANCKYTCHQECRRLIQLDCSHREGDTHNKPSPENTLTQNYCQ